MSDSLSKALWVDLPKPIVSPKDRVERALQKALDATTPERPGVPWDEKLEEKTERGYWIPGSD